MKVSQYQVGVRRFVALVGEHEIPVRALANAFIYCEFLNASFSTKLRVAQELKITLDYFDSVSIDVEGRVAAGEFLTPSEISSFYGVMRLRRDSFEIREKISVISKRLDSKKFRNAVAASQFTNNKVDVETTAGRVRTLRKYITYLTDYFHGDRASQELKHRQDRLVASLKEKERYKSAKATKTTFSAVELSEKVIPDKYYERFLEVIKPSSKDNPFNTSKLRNYLILSVMSQTGMRRSEVCKIKISDCLFHGSGTLIRVYSTPDDPTDPRLSRPNKKTGRPHLTGIRPELMEEISFYVQHVRNNFEKAGQHDFLFVAEKDSRKTVGQPLTRGMINYILARVSRAVGFDINPHLLRHKWNERFSEKGREKGLDRGYLEDMRRNAMGWHPESDMGRIYNDKFEQMAAINLMLEHQEKVDGAKK